MFCRDPLTYRLSLESDGSAVVYLLTPPIARGDVWVVEAVSAYNGTTAGSDATFGVFDGNRYTWFETIDLELAATWYLFERELTLLTDYQVVVMFENTVDGDMLLVNVNGYVREPFTSP